jgi:hypothetical protein
MDKKFWVSIRENNYAIPVEHSVQNLTEELFSYIGSTDPELRDTIGLEAFYNWLTQGLYSTKDLEGYIARLTANLKKGIGEINDDSVFLRSFSALWLSLIVQKDNETQVLERGEIERVLEAALAYFTAEIDLRGYVQIKGYAHAIAHASDLFYALANSKYLSTSAHIRILDCIANKLRNGAGGVYLYNEDGRIARAIQGIFVLNTLTVEQIKEWLVSLCRNWNGAWQSEEKTRAYFNGRNLLRALHLYILMGKGKETPNKEIILMLLQQTLEQAKPWEWSIEV